MNSNMKSWKEENTIKYYEGLFGNKKEILDVKDFNGSLDYMEVAEYKDFYGIAYYNKIGEGRYELYSTPALFPKELGERLVSELNKKLENINYPEKYLSYVVDGKECSEIKKRPQVKYLYSVRKSMTFTKTRSDYTVDKLALDKSVLGFFKNEEDAIKFAKEVKSYKGKKLDVSLDYVEHKSPNWVFIGIEDLYDYDTNKRKTIYGHILSFMNRLINDDTEFNKHFVGITTYFDNSDDMYRE